MFFVVTHVDIHYHRPARLGEVITITTDVVSIRKASIIMKNRILRDDTLLVEADVTIACVDHRGRPQRLPEQFQSLMTHEITS
jgi:acyl-CoA thioester hydrolase